MAWQAAARWSGGTDFELRDVLFQHPIRLLQPELEVVCRVSGSGAELDFAVVPADSTHFGYSSGRLLVQAAARPPERSPRQLAHATPPAQLYDQFRENGILQKGVFRVVRSLRWDAQSALAELALPAERAADFEAFALPVPLLDGAVQTAMAHFFATRGHDCLRVPFQLERLRRWGAPPTKLLAHAQADPDHPGRYEVALTDEAGRLWVLIEGLVLRPYREHGDLDPARVYYLPDWRPAAVLERAPATRVLVHCAAATWLELSAAAPALGGDLRWTAEHDAGQLETHRPEVLLVMGDDLDEGGEGVAAALVHWCQAALARLPRLRLIHCWREAEPRPRQQAVTGMLRSLTLEQPAFRGTTLCLDQASDLVAALAQTLADSSSAEVRYRDGQRQVLGWSAGLPTAEPIPLVVAAGHYLISGGLGGLGRMFAASMLADGARLTLLGRSGRDEAELRQLLGSAFDPRRVAYRAVDLTNETQLVAAISAACAQFGPLRGVLHTAGLHDDALLAHKRWPDFARVLAPKLLGCELLDRACADQPLDYFVMCSSVSGALGNLGQTDYAYANAFLDAYAELRETLRARGQRCGRSVAIAWPYWREGGMRLDEAGQRQLARRFGLHPLERAHGLAALRQILASAASRVLVMDGDFDRIREVLGLAPAAPSKAVAVVAAPAASGADPHERALNWLRELLAAELKLSEAQLDPRMPLDRFGMDSITLIGLSERLEPLLGPLPRTLFFEWENLEEAAAWLVREHGQHFASAAVTPEPEAPTASEPNREAPEGQGIAIIGLAARLPQAPDLARFWENLCAGRDCIAEVPATRWDAAALFDEDGDGYGTTRQRWGGFLDDVDAFDAAFFRIAPTEAKLMDPQERLLLEQTWHVLEDAALTRADLEASQVQAGGEVGVFIGCMYRHYELLDHAEEDRPRLALGSYWWLANRISWHFDLHGPSLAVDTACASALTAVHLACESLRRGECGLALAGAANLSLHPHKYLGLNQLGLLASGRHSRGLGAGDGYLPGEGVGMLLLKPLARAQADGDRIRAVIRGSFANHGGHTSGLTVPSARAHARLWRRLFERSACAPASVTYVESAANGSAIADALEIAGLARVFADAQLAQNSVALGTVKSNLGHLEAASGISQLAKVVLQLEQRWLVPTIHCDPPNPNLQLARSPFAPVRAGRPWTATGPQRALLTSIGAGGANAALILDEAPPQRAWAPQPGRFVFPLSARTPQALTRQIAALIDWLEQHPQAAMDQIAHTLQRGREAFAVRAAVVAESHAELLAAGGIGASACQLAAVECRGAKQGWLRARSCWWWASYAGLPRSALHRNWLCMLTLGSPPL